MGGHVQVTQVRKILEGLGLEIASSDEARKILSLKAATRSHSSPDACYASSRRLARSHSEEESAHLLKYGASAVVMAEHEIAKAMIAGLKP